jgi:hypothetical protein
VPAIEKAGTLNSDKVVEVMRDQVVTTAGGVIKYMPRTSKAAICTN